MANYTLKIPEREYPNIIKKYSKGMSQKKIGKLYDVQARTITKILIKNNITIRKLKKEITEEIEKKVVEEYISKKALKKDLIKKHNISRTSVNFILNSNGIWDTRIDLYKRLNKNKQEIINDYIKVRISLKRMAKKYKVDQRTLAAFLKEKA